jgi:predicted transcriptional regulator
MKIPLLMQLLEARLVCGDAENHHHVEHAFASDLMSDVLTLDDCCPLLITGLSNMQTIRTAEMADIHTVLFARGKNASPEMVELAQQNKMLLLETSYSIFRTCGILYQNGVKPVY